MAQRLRLYFGSGRSNTAPEILEGDSEAQQGDENIVTLLRARPPSAPRPYQEPPAQSTLARASTPRPETLLKRSSSMFIPQLSAYSDPRPTKSSSMHISLQRASTLNNEDACGCTDDTPPPRYSPPGPAPAYAEVQMDQEVLQHPPPPYCSQDSLNSQAFLTDPNLPKRRVFSIGSNGHTLCSIGPPGINLGGICIRRTPTEGTDIQHFRIFPHGGTGWSIQQPSVDRCAVVNGGPQRVVFQVQQNPNQELEACPDVGVASPRGTHAVMNYPKVRMERSLSHQRVPLDGQQQKNGAYSEDVEESRSDQDGQRVEGRSRSNSCTFKISRNASGRQPQFKIYFTPRAGDEQDVSLDDEQSKVNEENCVWCRTGMLILTVDLSDRDIRLSNFI